MKTKRRSWWPIYLQCPKCGKKMKCEKSKPVSTFDGSNYATMVQKLKCTKCKNLFKHTIQVFREGATV